MPSKNLIPLHLSVDSRGNLFRETQGHENLDAAIEQVLSAVKATGKTIHFQFRGVGLVADSNNSADGLRQTYHDLRNIVNQRKIKVTADLRNWVNDRSSDLGPLSFEEFLHWLGDYLTVTNDAGYNGMRINRLDLIRKLGYRGFTANKHAGFTNLSPRHRAEQVLGHVLFYLEQNRVVPPAIIQEVRDLETLNFSA